MRRRPHFAVAWPGCSSRRHNRVRSISFRTSGKDALARFAPGPPSDSLWPSDGSALAAPPESVAVQDAISSARTAGTPDDASGERWRVAQWLSPGANHTSARARPRRGGGRWWHAGAWGDAPDTARVAGAGRGFLLRVQDWGADRR